MRSPQDVGGLPEGPVDPSEHMLNFWEKQADGLRAAVGAKGLMSSHESRRAIESLGEDAMERTPRTSGPGDTRTAARPHHRGRAVAGETFKSASHAAVLRCGFQRPPSRRPVAADPGRHDNGSHRPRCPAKPGAGPPGRGNSGLARPSR